MKVTLKTCLFLWFKIHEQLRAVCLSLHRLKLSQWRGRTDDVCVEGEWEGKEYSSVSRSWSRQQKMIILTHSSSVSHLPWWKNNRDPFQVYCITLQSLRSVFTFIILFDPHANLKREPWWILLFPFSRWENMGLKGGKWLFHWKTVQISARTRTHVFCLSKQCFIHCLNSAQDFLLRSSHFGGISWIFPWAGCCAQQQQQ